MNTPKTSKRKPNDTPENSSTKKTRRVYDAQIKLDIIAKFKTRTLTELSND